ncbi:MAG: hypothetical protein IKU10_04375 [Clostridia bacterium]|nr:hypothetical protein [Clostridia bacterium]
MSTLDETMDTARAWLNLATQKTVETVEQQKIRLAIAKKKNELSHLYEVLGKLYFQYGDQCGQRKGVQVLRQDIEVTVAQLAELQQRLENPVTVETVYEEPLDEE